MERRSCQGLTIKITMPGSVGASAQCLGWVQKSKENHCASNHIARFLNCQKGEEEFQEY